MSPFKHGKTSFVCETIRVAAELERLPVRYDVQQALHRKDGDFKDLIADMLEVLDG